MGVRLLIARPVAGTVGETRRVAHVLPAPQPGEPLPLRLVAFCGAVFGPDELELMDGPGGMPCERCLARIPPPGRELGEGPG
ncbi:hypothetical protein [Haloechinothrix sp. LS1_15]|uniref:hypothetical protein n=1 Tax=Haloechinothrix sp. LS1_15 TaxID=2652248 RepID=UPI00294B1294|nr:hypothetical protein [Haloechinothrix sp. LS1_15]